MSPQAARVRISNARPKTRRALACIALAAAMDSMFCADRALAVTRTFISPGGGNWSVGSNWSGGVVPGNGDTALIPRISTSLDTHVNYDYTGSPVTLASVELSS